MSLDAPSRPLLQVGGPEVVLTDEQVRGFVAQSLASVELDGRSVCVVVPDGTRSCPLPLLMRAVYDAVHERVSRLSVLSPAETISPSKIVSARSRGATR